jgi:hypothetical protein
MEFCQRSTGKHNCEHYNEIRELFPFHPWSPVIAIRI